MSKDETTFEDELSDDATPDEPQETELLEDEVEPDDALVGADDEGSVDDQSDSGADSDTAESDTEALDDLEAEELEMLTEDEASETIVVDEATQLRDIRRAQISIERGEVGGATEDEFVCSICFLVKKSSQLSSRRKKVCLDCAD
ncbi:MAG: DUF4193 family protein [Actinomycetota bacterium]|nr:DUF4193 family protein [Actinomycetota bacterium]